MARARDSEVWEAATVVALGCATLLAVAYLLALWRPLAPARRHRIAGGFFARHAENPPAPVSAPAPAPPPARAAAAPAPVKAAAPVVPAGDGLAGLSKEDRDAVIAALGGWSPQMPALIGRTLFDFAASPAGVSLLKHPKAVKFLLDQDSLIQAFMGQDRVRRLCAEPAALRRYWSDRSDPKGFGRDLASFRRSLDAGAAAAVLSSRLADAVIGRCGAISAVGADPTAMMGVARANPDLASLAMDPRFLQAVGSNARVMAAVQKMTPALASAALSAQAGRR